MTKSTWAAIGLASSMFLAGMSYADKQEGDNGAIQVHRARPDDGAPTSGSTGSLSPITAHGGPVMDKPNVYLIWYGNWNQNNGSDTANGMTLVKNFLAGLQNSAYFQINSTYAGVNGAFQVLAGNTTTDSYSQGTRLRDSQVQAIVSNAISSGNLPKDTTGVYFVLTSSDVSEQSGFCSRYCGWHTSGTIQGLNIKYAFVGNANRCLSACAAQTISPNGNAGVDGMISVIAHELEEATTDPNLNAWYDSSGAENADKCAWTFGQPAPTGPLAQLKNGAYYNMTLNGQNFLVQRNLSAADNKCYISLNGLQ